MCNLCEQNSFEIIAKLNYSNKVGKAVTLYRRNIARCRHLPVPAASSVSRVKRTDCGVRRTTADSVVQKPAAAVTAAAASGWGVSRSYDCPPRPHVTLFTVATAFLSPPPQYADATTSVAASAVMSSLIAKLWGVTANSKSSSSRATTTATQPAAEDTRWVSLVQC